MCLLLITNLFPDTREPWRGLDNVTLLHALKQARPDMDIDVIALRPSLFKRGPASALQPRPEDASLKPHYAWTGYVPKFGGLNHLLVARAASRALEQTRAGERAAVVLTPWLFPDACGVVQIPALQGKPTYAVAQGSDVHRYLEMPWRRRAILAMIGKASGVATRSADLRTRLLAAGASAEKVHSIYNGVDTNMFTPGDRTDARTALAMPTEAKVALFVGNFLPVKGLDLLLSASARVKESLKCPFRLVLVGGGPLEGALREQSRQLGMEENVVFAGRQSPGQVAKFLQAADVACLSSHNEGVPNVVLESFASGRPLVCTDVGGIAEVWPVHLAGSGLVSGRDPVVYAKAMLTAINHPPDATELRQHGLQFSWMVCAARYLSMMGASNE